MSDTENNTRAITPPARLMYPAFFEAKSFDEGEPKFSGVLVFDKEAQETAEFQNLKRIAQTAARVKFGDKPPKLRNPFRPAEDKEGVAGFNPGDVFISVTSKNKPKVVDRRKVDGKFPVITDEDRLYNGCIVRCSVNSFAYDTKGNKGVSFGLNNAQFVADGERIAGAGRADPNSEFDDLSGENISEGEAKDLF